MLTTDQVQLRCLFGLPSSEQILELSFWLDQDPARAVAIIEDEVAIGVELPERMELYWMGASDAVLMQLARDHLFMPFSFESIKGNGERVKERLEKAWTEVHLKASDFQGRGLDILSNLLANVPHINESRKGSGLKGAFTGRAAVICGAGPSLEREAPRLEALKDRALILAGGSALAALSHLGVAPHMGGYIDPNPPFERFASSRAFDLPLLFQSRLDPQIAKMHGGEKVWFEGSGIHPAEQWLTGTGCFDAGWNVATFLVAVALFMGCDQIALVGVDLDLVGGRAYAGGVGEGHKEQPKDWQLAADWLDDYETVSLDALMDRTPWDVQGHVHAALSAAPMMELQLERVEALMHSFDRASSLCQQLLQLLEQAYPSDPTESGGYALIQREVEEEPAYQIFLQPVWEVWKDLFARQMPQGLPKAFAIELNKWLFLKGICDDARKI